MAVDVDEPIWPVVAGNRGTAVGAPVNKLGIERSGVLRG